MSGPPLLGVAGLIGPNGAGKTSLLKTFANLDRVDRGEILLDEKPLVRWPSRELARRLAYLPQGAQTHWPLNVRRLIELGRFPHLGSWQRLGDKDERAINRAMQLAEVSAFSDRWLDTLSSGERSRVLIARELATEPTAILAGEPVAALDPYHQFYTMEILRKHCARDGTGLVALHDLAIAARFCHRLVLLDEGRIVCDRKPEGTSCSLNSYWKSTVSKRRCFTLKRVFWYLHGDALVTERQTTSVSRGGKDHDFSCDF